MMKKVFVIAEAGVNHNGSIEIAKKMIDVAKNCEADAIKFQTFRANKLVTRYAEKAEYQKKTSVHGEVNQYQMLKKLELDVDTHKELIAYCNLREIQFLSTPFDFDSIALLSKLGMQTFKIPSGEITNLPYLEKIGCLDRQVILSTGMASIGEIEDAIRVLIESGTKKNNICILHANTEYPTPMCDVNLRAMQTIHNTFKVDVGYSDHTLGIEVDIAAVAMGASMIEKHFTLDKNMDGPDHKASLEPHELEAMIKAIRNIELALGDGIKRASPSEKKNKSVARKSIVAKTDILKGETFSVHNLSTKRPGHGMSPMRWYELIGQIAHKDYCQDELI